MSSEVHYDFCNRLGNATHKVHFLASDVNSFIADGWKLTPMDEGEYDGNYIRFRHSKNNKGLPPGLCQTAWRRGTVRP